MLSSVLQPGVTVGDVERSSPALAIVRLPGVIDRPQMVEGTSANTVLIREDERWAEPLDQMVLRVLRQDLVRVSNGRITNDRVAVDIDQFMAFGDNTVRLVGTWRTLNGSTNGPREITHAFRLSMPTETKNGASVAATLSVLLAELATKIVQTP